MLPALFLALPVVLEVLHGSVIQVLPIVRIGTKKQLGRDALFSPISVKSISHFGQVQTTDRLQTECDA